MITWLSIQIFQTVFNTTITGDALALLRVIGFFELFAEIVSILAVFAAAVVATVSRGKND